LRQVCEQVGWRVVVKAPSPLRFAGALQDARKRAVVPGRDFRLRCAFMSKPACPMCEMNDVLEHTERYECVTCGHEWERTAAPEVTGPRIVKDAHGNVLADGDCVILIKDLKLGGSQVLKGGSKSKPIRLEDGDHEISCKVDGIAVGLKACFVKKA
jgi:protein PhnA